MNKFFTAFSQWLLEFGMILFYPFAGIFNKIIVGKPGANIKKNGRSILLVERWLNRNIFHNKWKMFLEQKGFDVHLFYLPIYKSDFNDSAKDLENYIEKNNLNDFTLVGISSGGLTALIYLQELDGWKRVKNFISLASPFYGTKMILPLAFNKSCRELLPSSKIIEKIKNYQLLNKEKIICVQPKADQLVPLHSQHLKGTRREVLNIYGHNNLHLYHRETYSLIAELANK